MKMKIIFTVILIIGMSAFGFQAVYGVSWEEWWTYDGISGPSFWGLINPEWHLCNQGKRQSPVDIRPSQLLFDPQLQGVEVTDSQLNLKLHNSGHGILLHFPSKNLNSMVNISGGPLMYNYPIHWISIHFGLTDHIGSEHALDGRKFVAEVQMIGYNADLYSNFTLASQEPNGLVGIAILVDIGDLSNQALRRVTNKLAHVQYGGMSVILENMSILGFLPSGTNEYMTYEGSMTEPACQETITWIIMNKPIYITQKQLMAMRKLMQGDKRDPRAPLGGNFRPPQDLNARTIRTNVKVKTTEENKCPLLINNLEYKVQERRPRNYHSTH